MVVEHSLAFSSYAARCGKQSITQLVYADAAQEFPLASQLKALSAPHRHMVTRSLLLSLDRQRYPDAAIEEAVEGADWTRDGRRVCVRCAQLRWEGEYAGRWMARFSRLPVAVANSQPIDELQLALLTPRGVVAYRHDQWAASTSSMGRLTPFQGAQLTSTYARMHTKYTSSKGHLVRSSYTHARMHTKYTSSKGHLAPLPGGQLQFYSKVGIRGWISAYELWILPRVLAAGAVPVGDVSYSDELMAAAAKPMLACLSASLTAAAYDGVPLAGESPSVRRAGLESLVRAVDETLHPGGDFEVAETQPLTTGDAMAMVEERAAASRSGGGRHGKGTTARSAWQLDCSWRRDGRRVVCRVAQLTWQKSSQRWRVLFSAIRLSKWF